MKIIGFKELGKKKKSKRHLILCVGKIFKPLAFVMAVAITVLAINLFTGTFFANMHANMQNFVESFVNLF